MPAFAALVLVVAVAGISNEATASGTQLFFWARLAHAVAYTVGIPYLRSAAFIASLVGMIRIATQIWATIPPTV
jgi:uncharacterized MAPEG superfamily protein